MSLLIVSILALAGLSFALTTMLVLASRYLYVFEDPRIDEVEVLLPQANCGGCGYPSCHAFAEALVGQKTTPGMCQVSSDDQRTAVAELLNVSAEAHTKTVARLACGGGHQVAVNRAHYIGTATCNDANQVAGGAKACTWGCLGLADCAKACNFAAITMDKQGLPVVDESRCTACGDCVTICPKDLFSLQPITHQLWVACKNQQSGDVVLEACQVGCTACGRCALDAEDQHLSMLNNLPQVDYTKSLAGREAIERCPTGAIVWLDEHGGITYGHDAKALRPPPSLTRHQL